MAQSLIPTARLATIKSEIDASIAAFDALNVRNSDTFINACAPGGAWAMLADAIASIDTALKALNRKTLKSEEKSALGIDNLGNEVSQIRKVLAVGAFSEFHSWLVEQRDEKGKAYASMQTAGARYAAIAEYEERLAEHNKIVEAGSEFGMAPNEPPPVHPDDAPKGSNKGPFDASKKWNSIKKSVTADEMAQLIKVMLADDDVKATMQRLADATITMGLATGNANAANEAERAAA